MWGRILRKSGKEYAWLPQFSLWIPIVLAKIYFFPRGLNLALKPLYLVGIVLKTVMELTFDSFRVLISTSSSSMFPSEWNKSLSILSSMAFNWFLSEFIRTISWFLWSSRSGLSRRTTSLQRQKKIHLYCRVIKAGMTRLGYPNHRSRLGQFNKKALGHKALVLFG